MPRFQTLQQLLHNDRDFQDFLAWFTGGTSGHDHLNGTESGNMLFAGRGDDDVAGKAGNDMLSGGGGKDLIWGGSGNDRLSGRR
jgi:Ca2+-binding RTX toxin-like protein